MGRGQCAQRTGDFNLYFECCYISMAYEALLKLRVKAGLEADEYGWVEFQRFAFALNQFLVVTRSCLKARAWWYRNLLYMGRWVTFTDINEIQFAYLVYGLDGFTTHARSSSACFPVAPCKEPMQAMPLDGGRLRCDFRYGSAHSFKGFAVTSGSADSMGFRSPTMAMIVVQSMNGEELLLIGKLPNQDKVLKVMPYIHPSRCLLSHEPSLALDGSMLKPSKKILFLDTVTF
ncbi:hypothetical protein CPB84DRAFT_1826333 [Gymnopilus junonius]|uniref:Uncharacterized protein n=1 Tax=Gymnopilus junonius TaxID=109634 RepID=A0A9P5NIT9_GYMJU|nr:hypothetical protein CPB84DRAFT_1826333 [Gymnopilus junonius]